MRVMPRSPARPGARRADVARPEDVTRAPEPGDIEPGDWIKYRSGYYGGGRLAEVHGLGSDTHSGDYAVTTEGNVLFDRILEIRRRPINVVVFHTSRA